MKRKGQVDDLIRARERGEDAFFVLDHLIIKDEPPDAKIRQSHSEGEARSITRTTRSPRTFSTSMTFRSAKCGPRFRIFL